jgi:hypothetical protein
MTTGYDAGTSVGRYVLQATDALRTQAKLIAGFQQLAKAQAIKPPAGASGAAAPLNQQAAAATKAAIAQQKLATEIAKTAAADQILARNTANASAAQDRAAQAALRRAAAEKRAAQGGGGGAAVLPRTFAGFTPAGIAQAAGFAAGPQLVAQMLQAGAAAAKQALDLREAQNALKAVSGSTVVYADSLATARRQQVLFGGSLQENIEGLQGLVITSRDTGANLQDLVDLSARLNIKSPEQGIAGARIGLQEAFSEGNITSLARRFEIPRAALALFKDETVSTAEKVQALSTYLDSIGITSAAVAGKADQTALAYRGLNAELERTRLNAGGQLADAFARQATGLARLFGVINDNPQALAELNALREGRTGVTEADFDKAAQTIRVKNILPAEDQARSSAFARDKLTGTTANTAALDAAKNQLVLFAATSDDASARVAALLDTFGRTGNIAAFEAAVRVLLGSVDNGTRKARDYRDAITKLRDELADSAEASVKDAAQKDVQSAATELLAARSKLAVDQFLALNPTIDASAAASIAAAAGYDPQIRQLIVMAVEARNAQGALAALAGGTAVDRGEREFDSPQELAQGRTAGLQLMRDLEKKNADAAKATAEARRNQLLQTGTALQAVQVRQQQYNEAVKEFGKDSAQAINAQTDLIEAQKSAAKPKRGAKDPNAVGLGVLDQDAIQRGEDAKAQLAEVNRLLERTNLSEHQRNDLLEKRRRLEEQITQEGEKQARASIDARLGAVQDAQKRLQEAREAAGLQRQLQSGKFSESQQNTARLRLEEISLEQQKRALDIQKDAKAAGVAIPGVGAAPGTTAPLPIANVAQLPPVQLAGGVNLSLTIQLNPVTGAATVVNPPAGVNVLQVLVKAA